MPRHLDFGPPAPFDRVVDAHYHWPRWHEGRDQQKQESMADGTGRPPCVAEHAVVDGKAWGLLKAHDA
jgi:hypothetical protein